MRWRSLEQAFGVNDNEDGGRQMEMHPRFGDIVENGWASEGNPTRVGYFVREGRRTGFMNPGRYFEVTDGNGKFWELPVDRDHKITVTCVTEHADERALTVAWETFKLHNPKVNNAEMRATLGLAIMAYVDHVVSRATAGR